VTASEFSFLALGLVLGLVSGAALIEFARARPPAPREVKVTVSPDSVPRRRPATLADDAFSGSGAEPARGGPADRRMSSHTLPAGMLERRTSVPFGTPTQAGVTAEEVLVMPSVVPPIVASPETTAIPSPQDGGPIMLATTSVAGAVPEIAGETTATVGIPISGGEDPMIGALRVTRPVGGRVAADRQTPTPSAPVRPGPAAATLWASVAPPRVAPSPATVRQPGRAKAIGDQPRATASPPAPRPAAAEPCAEERRIADERCEVAVRARAQADAAADAVRIARRSYDSHESAAAAASLDADPRTVQSAKEEAQAAFRSAVGRATTPDEHEAAARDWLDEINRINGRARDAASAVTRERAAAREIGLRLERLALEADAARIAADNADAACVAARSAVSDCDELEAQDRMSSLVAPVAGAPGRIHIDEDETLGIALEAGGEPLVFRLLRGDRAAMSTLMTSLAGDDLDARRRWQLLVTRLLEAVIADAIEGSALEFPDDHPFWGMYDRLERRDITHALASLGFRFDGLGGWADGREPSQRDLSLALGYAGLDPMRVRHWPTGDSMTALFADATVAADEYLAARAGDMTLAEMIAMLGRRADGLAEVWNVWGKIRPLLLAEG
jgi:hypothetical protein